MNLLLLLAAFSIDGTWVSSNGMSALYTEEGKVTYQDCAVEFKVKTQAAQIKIDTLKVACTHDSYWPFNQKMTATQFTVSSDGVVRLPSGAQAGTFSNDGLVIAYDQDGSKTFIDAVPTATGIHFEWSKRGFESLNFDVSAECTLN